MFTSFAVYSCSLSAQAEDRDLFPDACVTSRWKGRITTPADVQNIRDNGPLWSDPVETNNKHTAESHALLFVTALSKTKWKIYLGATGPCIPRKAAVNISGRKCSHDTTSSPPPPKKKTRMKELLWEWSLANAVWVLLSCWDCPKFSPRAGTEIKKPFKLTRKLSPSAFNRIALKKPQQLTLSFQNET